MNLYCSPCHKISRNWSKPTKWCAFLFNMKIVYVRPQDTQPQAARILQVHLFELGPKIFQLNEFI